MQVKDANLEEEINKIAVSLRKALGCTPSDGQILKHGSQCEKDTWDIAVVSYVNENWAKFENPEEVIQSLLSSAA